MKEFSELDFPHKVFFSAKNYAGLDSLIWLKSYEGKEHIGDIVNNRWSYRKHFDVVKWLNK